METKIKKHYKLNFNSSPVEVEENEIDFLIKNNCECSYCGKSLFEMDDFPELLVEDSELLCEECYSGEYRTSCPICEESYDIKDGNTDFIVINEEVASEVEKQPGIYKVLEKSFFLGNIFTGFEGFYDNALKLVVNIRINEFKKTECSNECCEVYPDFICPNCINKFIRKNNYLKSDSIPCILLKRYENDELFKDCSPEQLRKLRINLIQKRITCRGMIELGNKLKISNKLS